MSLARLVSWESLDSKDSVLKSVRELYESTQAVGERIPWEWIGRVGERRQAWRPGRWSPHLVIAAMRDEAGEIGDPIGFVHGAHLPNLGGYVCYLGVSPNARGLGVSTYLFAQMARIMRATAGAENTPLEYIFWESHRPAADASQEEHDLWVARCRSFVRAGALWVEGIVCHTPAYDGSTQPTLLELFVIPQERSLDEFDGEKLREIASNLLTEVYHIEPTHPWYRASLPEGVTPRLRPGLEAIGVSLDAAVGV